MERPRVILLCISCVLIYHLLLQVQSFSTTGTFFVKVKGKYSESEGNSHYTNEDFHKFGLDSPCVYVARASQGAKLERLTVMHSITSYNEVWKKVPNNEYTDCKQAQLLGMKSSGFVKIVLPSPFLVVQAYCDMATKGGGWTVFQRRVDNTVNFQRDWQNYKNGFGDSNGNFWLGLDALHQLTAVGNVTLRMDLIREDGVSGYAEYNAFKILDESQKYKLEFGAYSGTVGDSLSVARNMNFSTYDNDNDNGINENCAGKYKGGWWYNECFDANLNNGFYKSSPRDAKTMSWFHWSGKHGNVKFSEMKLRIEI